MTALIPYIPSQKGRSTGKNAHGQSRAAAPAGRAAQPGRTLCAQLCTRAHKPKNNQQKENATWKTGKKKK